MGSLAIVLALRRFAPAVPGSLVAVAAGVLAVSLFELDEHGVDIVGTIESGLPEVGLPDVGLSDYGALIASAVGVMLVGFAEGLGAAKTYATRDHYEIDANRELLGLGAGNVGAGLASGMVVNGSLSKTAVNGSAGARSQVSGLIVAVLTIVTLLLLTGLFEELPEATLAAVVIAAVVELVDIEALQDLRRASSRQLTRIYGVAARADLIAALAALFGVLLFDTLPGLFIGIAVSMLLLLYRSSRPNVAVLGRLPDDGRFADVERFEEAEAVGGVVVLRPEAGLFFANAEDVRGRILAAVAAEGAHAVVLDGETMPFVDVTAVRMLGVLAADLDRRGVTLAIARDVGQVRDLLATQDRTGLLTRVYPTVREAVAAVSDTGPEPEPASDP